VPRSDGAPSSDEQAFAAMIGSIAEYQSYDAYLAALNRLPLDQRMALNYQQR
jgi:hypothetical protein